MSVSVPSSSQLPMDFTTSIFLVTMYVSCRNYIWSLLCARCVCRNGAAIKLYGRAGLGSGKTSAEKVVRGGFRGGRGGGGGGGGGGSLGSKDPTGGARILL